MLILVKAIGIFVVCAGVVNLIKPVWMRRMLGFWKQGKRLYLGAGLRILFGIIFLMAAPQGSVPQGLYIIGTLMLLGGAAILVMGLEKAKAMISWWDGKPDRALRLVAAVVLGIGALILSCA